MIYSNPVRIVYGITRRILLSLFCVFIFLQTAKAQIYTNNVVFQDHATNASQSIDGNPATFSEIEASSGALIGIGSYHGAIELKFPTLVPANTTVYVRIETEDKILSSLVGGTLGNVVSNLTGVLLVGNQEFKVEVKDASNNVILSGASNNPLSFGGENLKVVLDKNKHNYLLITPSQAFQSIKITTGIGSLLGLGTKRSMKVYDPFYYSSSSGCPMPSFTSFDGTGISLELLNLGGGVSNMERAIDKNFPTFSTLSLGVLSVASSITQYVYFQAPSPVSTVYAMRFKVDPALLNIGIGQNVLLELKNGTTTVSSQPLQNYLTPANVAALQAGNSTTIYVTPAGPADRVIVDFNGILGVTISQSLEINEIYRISSPPILNVASSDTTVCEGTSATLVADAVNTTNEIRWYATDTSISPMHINPSGAIYNTGLLFSDTTIWVASGIPGCPNESIRIPVNIDIIPAPTTSGLSNNVLGQYCASDSITVVVQNTGGTQFGWFFAPNFTNPITNGIAQNGQSYLVGNDSLLVYNLNSGNHQDTLYITYQDSATGCWNAPGNEYIIPLNILDEPAPTTTDSIQYFCIADHPTVGDIISSSTGSGTMIWYDENGDLLNTTDLLQDGMTYYAVMQGAVCTSSDSLAVMLSISTLPTPTANDTIQLFCEGSHPTIADIQINQTTVEWYDGNGNQLLSSAFLSDSTVYYAKMISPNCQSDDSLAVFVAFEDQYNVHFVGDTSNVCLMDTVTYQVSQGMTAYTWIITGGTVIAGGTSTDNTITVQWNDSIGGTIWVAYTSTNGCLIQTQNAISITPYNCSNLTITKTVNNLYPMIGEEITFTITVVNNGVAGVSGSVISEQIHSGFTYVSDSTNNGSYNVNIGEWNIPYLAGGETAVLIIKVTVNPTGDYINIASIVSTTNNIELFNTGAIVKVIPECLTIYNEISPNGDGVNDYLHIDCIEQYPNSSIQIFNRYGSPVFKTKGYKNDWGGIANVSGIIGKGDPLPSGTYYYILKIEKKDINTSGWVYIVR